MMMGRPPMDSGADRTTPMGPGGEFDLIRALLGESEDLGPAVLVGPGDDAAVLQTGRLVVSTDLSVEDVHFRRSWISFEEVGFRAVTVAASDLAGKFIHQTRSAGSLRKLPGCAMLNLTRSLSILDGIEAHVRSLTAIAIGLWPGWVLQFSGAPYRGLKGGEINMEVQSTLETVSGYEQLFEQVKARVGDKDVAQAGSSKSEDSAHTSWSASET